MAAVFNFSTVTTKLIAQFGVELAPGADDGQNFLARSLHEHAHDHNPGFLRFIRETGLPFQPHVEFREADLDARSALCRRLAEQSEARTDSCRARVS